MSEREKAKKEFYHKLKLASEKRLGNVEQMNERIRRNHSVTVFIKLFSIILIRINLNTMDAFVVRSSHSLAVSPLARSISLCVNCARVIVYIFDCIESEIEEIEMVRLNGRMQLIIV